MIDFEPWEPLLAGHADAACRAAVIVPVRNEAASLVCTLDAFAAQQDLAGDPLPLATFEILVLLNNCSDDSAEVSATWAREHPDVRIHLIERELSPEKAFVGTARRMLMDTAWQRLRDRPECAILSTDSDTMVAPDWVARTMAALGAGADAVGGAIALKPGEIETLPEGARRAYVRDRRYQALVAELESRLDPQDGDPSPRHLQHFGASLACTPAAYSNAGGMPAVTPLEDVAFVDRLRLTGARLRHDPAVRVYTSSRMHGRVEVGLSGQLRLWQQMSERGEPHCVLSAARLAHRFRTLARLRRQAAEQGVPAAVYLADVDCDRLVEETFRGAREGEIRRVNRRLAAMLRGSAPEARAGSLHASAAAAHATPAG